MSVQLWAAVDNLTKPYRQRLERDGGVTEWVQVASLFDQLAEAVQTGSSNSGRGVQGSRPPLDVACCSLLIEIGEAVRDACWGLEIKRQHDTPADLRRIASTLLAQQDADDEIEWWVDAINGWCRRIRSTISSDPDRSWRLHGVPCPDCGTRTISEIEDGQPVRRPVLTVTWNNGLVNAVECQACDAAWFRGTDLDNLAERLLAQRNAETDLRIA